VNSASATSFRGGRFNNFASFFWEAGSGGSTKACTKALCAACHIARSGSAPCSLDKEENTLEQHGRWTRAIGVNAPASLRTFLHPELRESAVHAPIIAQHVVACLLREEQPCGTLRERMEGHPHVLPCKREERDAPRVLGRTEHGVRLL